MTSVDLIKQGGDPQCHYEHHRHLSTLFYF